MVVRSTGISRFAFMGNDMGRHRLDRLTHEISQIVKRGREQELSDDDVAIEITRFLKRESRRSQYVKPKRGIGVVTQADTLRGV